MNSTRTSNFSRYIRTIYYLYHIITFNFITFSLDGGISFLPEWCFFKSEANPYDGSDYDTVVQLPNSTTLLTPVVRVPKMLTSLSTVA